VNHSELTADCRGLSEPSHRAPPTQFDENGNVAGCCNTNSRTLSTRSDAPKRRKVAQVYTETLRRFGMETEAGSELGRSFL